MFVTIFDATIHPLYNISMAARTCYNSREKDSDENREGFIAGLEKRGHEAPIEFAYIIFDIKGISRSCLAQLSRHRLCSFCVKSQRYVDQNKEGHIIPPKIKENPEALSIYENAVMHVKNVYKELEELGIPREDARYILPEATTTDLMLGMNFRQLRHVLALRLDKHAQWEIRELANKIKDLIIEKGWKVIVEDLIKE